MLGPLPMLLAPPTVTLAAATITDSWNPTSLIGTVFTPAAVIVALLTGWLRTKADYQRLESDNDRLVAELVEERGRNTQMQDRLAERVVPALTKSSLVLEAVQSLLTTEVHLRDHDRRPPERQ